MGLETHPIWHYLFVLVVYNVGLAVNVVLGAHIAISEKTNALRTYQDYLAFRWPPLLSRWIICVFLFLVVWENPAVPFSASLEKFMDDSIATHLGVAGLLGFGCDELFSKLMAALGLQKELPPVPQADGGT